MTEKKDFSKNKRGGLVAKNRREGYDRGIILPALGPSHVDPNAARPNHRP